MMITLKNGCQLSFKRKKHAVEYKQKITAIRERYVNVVWGIPIYSLNALKIANMRDAVSKAPKASTIKIVFGFSVSNLINL